MARTTSPSSGNRNHTRGTAGSGLFSSGSWLMNIFTVVLRTLFWPLRRMTDLLLPAGEYDGLSPAVTEKASQQFVQYLKATLNNNNNGNNSSNLASDAFSTMGFGALQQETTTTQSLILVYLHSPIHRQATKLCQKIFNSSMLEYLDQNKDHIGGIRAIGASIHTSQGASLSFQLAASSFPCIALLQPPPSSTASNATSNNRNNPFKLVFKAEGPALQQMTSSQLFNLISATCQKHQMTVQEREARRLQQEQEAELRRQQDEEYQETLRLDQERARQKQEEKERQEQLQREIEEAEQKKIQEEQDRLERARALIRPEPSQGKSGTTRIRFQLPSGQKLERRFECDETIGALKAFLILHFAEEAAAQGGGDDLYIVKNISLSTNFPRKTYEDDSKSLEECDLVPQAVLMCQDLDA
ncbi:UBX domain containing protein [Nitzschia inconspicua]|uniref:UBX domain containing protein n=1 Tax=Nitzschia inconspicua TaxID=303405 RepID=A0A9K3PDI0_9STRA|nr:UBX domain containing protein [Nitzschia inconspicua]